MIFKDGVVVRKMDNGGPVISNFIGTDSPDGGIPPETTQFLDELLLEARQAKPFSLTKIKNWSVVEHIEADSMPELLNKVKITEKALIIFDLDGTLADRETHFLLPGVDEWFTEHGKNHAFAMATNQGGVGLRYWMQKNNFGDPAKYPTEEKIRRDIQFVLNQIGVPMRVHVCFAYQSERSREWSPVPPGKEASPEWKFYNRKPAPGMLLLAMGDTDPKHVLFVGDRKDDEMAAKAADVDFMLADQFFGRA